MNIVFKIKEKHLDDVRAIIKKIGETYEELDSGGASIEVEI